MREVAAPHMTQRDARESIPGALIRVEVGGGAGKRLQMLPCGRPARETLLDLVPSMDG